VVRWHNSGFALEDGGVLDGPAVHPGARVRGHQIAKDRARSQGRNFTRINPDFTPIASAIPEKPQGPLKPLHSGYLERCCAESFEQNSLAHLLTDLRSLDEYIVKFV